MHVFKGQMDGHRINASISAPGLDRIGVQTSRSASKSTNGRKFDSEAELVDSIRGIFLNGTSTLWTVMEELDSPSGIADLAAVRLSRNWKAAVSIGQVPPRWLYPLKCLPLGEGFSSEHFARIANVTSGSARATLNLYGTSGYCLFDREKRIWKKIKEPEAVAQKIIAREGKLQDWRRALQQACRYTSYAAQSWVVLDEFALANASLHADEFEKRVIGLAGICRRGSVEVVAPAIEREPRLLSRYWYANAEIARRLVGPKKFTP